MKFGKTLVTIALAGALSFGSCSKESSYEFHGKIDSEQIDFDTWGLWLGDYSLLRVGKKDSSTIRYGAISKEGDFWEVINLYNGDEKLTEEEVGKLEWIKVQKQFYGYLEKISEHKKEKALEAIK